MIAVLTSPSRPSRSYKLPTATPTPLRLHWAEGAMPSQSDLGWRSMWTVSSTLGEAETIGVSRLSGRESPGIQSAGPSIRANRDSSPVSGVENLNQKAPSLDE